MTDQTADQMAGDIRAALDALVQLPAADRETILREASNAAEGVAAMRYNQGDLTGEQHALKVMTRLRPLADKARQDGAQP